MCLAQEELNWGYSIPHLVCKNHQSIVSFASDGSTHTLGSMSHGVKCQKVILPDLKVIPEILQTGLFYCKKKLQAAKFDILTDAKKITIY